MNMLVGKVFSAFRVIHQQYVEVILSHAYTAVLVNGGTLFGVGADWTLEIYGAYYAYAGGGSFEFPDWNCVVCSGSVVVRQYLPGT